MITSKMQMISIIIVAINTFLMQDRLFSPLSISYTGTSWITGTPQRRVDWARGEDPSTGEDLATGLSALPHVCVLQCWHWSGASRPISMVSLDMLGALRSNEHNWAQVWHNYGCSKFLISIRELFWIIKCNFPCNSCFLTTVINTKHFLNFNVFLSKLQHLAWGEFA